MSAPEYAIVERLLTRLDLLFVSLDDDLTLLGEVPDSVDMFEAMPRQRRSASRATLKSFEQIEDQIARVFRVVPILVGEDTSRWFARDYADFMEKIGVLDSGARWSVIVRLRNELVHDYPIDAEVQFSRFRDAIAALPDLVAAHRGLKTFLQNELSDQRP